MEKSNIAVFPTQKITPQQACASAMEHAHTFDKVVIVSMENGKLDFIYSALTNADLAYIGVALQRNALEA
jgi:hypothetical protein